MVEAIENSLVLIADDEQQTTVMLSRIFQRENYRVEVVHDGISALHAANQLLPDLILLDVQMPGMNGFEVLRALRENPVTAIIPTIIVTAKARQPSDIAHGLNLGADDFVQKPFDPRELLARSKSKIKARKLEEELHRRTQDLEALLRVGEALNQNLVLREVLTLVPYLTLDLLPGKLAGIYHFSEDLQIQHYHIESKQQSDISNSINHEAVVSLFLQTGISIVSNELSHYIPRNIPYGVFAPLQHAGRLLGMLMLLSDTDVYDHKHVQLLEGIGRQAALALRNTQLYEIQANYATHLEEMVEAKTAELKSAQELLIRAEKLASIGHLAASIAHEINNPLQPIRINLEDMLEDLQNNVQIDIRAIESTQESVERIRRIVNQLLDFAGKRGTTNEMLQVLDVRDLIQGVVDLNRKLFEKEGIKIQMDFPTPLKTYGNKDQLQQVFMNLMLNALAAMDRGGTLYVNGIADKNEIVTYFTDNGCGIPVEEINKIFDPFFSTKPNGTGLGLFVSYGIIQNHHGSIEVESKVNVGTTFTIRLPVLSAQ